MKINIQPGTISFEELQSNLEQNFPNYTFKVRSKNYLVAAKSSSIGTNILLRKNKIHVVGNFPTMGGQMLFILFILLLGFVIPLIVYFAAFHGKMKSLEKEIGAYVQELVNTTQATEAPAEVVETAEIAE